MNPHPYASAPFAASLAHSGEPLYVDAWGAWVLVRPVGDGLSDAAGVYPFTPLSAVVDLAEGFAFLRDQGLLSVVLTLDDFHRPDLERLAGVADHLKPFKTHYVRRPGVEGFAYGQHHRRQLRHAARDVVAREFALADHLEEWTRLYDCVVGRHGLGGLHAFPMAHHQALAQMDGIRAVGAWREDRLVSAHVWAIHQGHAHSHLVASNDEGYESRAAFAVNDESVRLFADFEVINFGGPAGAADDASDGLARFKRGFANDQASSFICGKVLDSVRYAELAGVEPGRYFPAYRAPRPDEPKGP